METVVVGIPEKAAESPAGVSSATRAQDSLQTNLQAPVQNGHIPPADSQDPSANHNNPTTNVDNPTTDGNNSTTNGNNSTTNGNNPVANGQNPTTASPAWLETKLSSKIPEVTVREQWGGQYEFLLSCLGYCVGLSNVWRFPYLCYRNGGGVFFIPYFIVLFCAGLPLFVLELCLGQYGAAGPIAVWKCCPLLTGVGVGMICVSMLICIYYNVIIAWIFFYLGNSFQKVLPWSCEAFVNETSCGNHSFVGDAQAPTEIFWNKYVLGVVNSEGLHDPGAIQWQLALCLLAAWVVIFLCMLKGIRSSGKVVYLTATYPIIGLILVFAKASTLEGASEGTAYFLTPDWQQLKNPQVWNDAASQVFYSLGVGVGGLLSMASYNKFNNNVIIDTLIITAGNCFTSIFAGLGIFSILGHMAWRRGVAVGEVVVSGPGIAFVVYPEFLDLLPGSPFWSVLFFLMLFMLGIGTLFGSMEGITTVVLDAFPKLRKNMLHKTLFLAALCFTFYLLGLLFVTEGGIYWFTLIDSFSTSFGLIIISFFLCTGVSFIYGQERFYNDVLDMISDSSAWCKTVLKFFRLCWVVLTPLFLLSIILILFNEIYNTSLHYGSYVYPLWGKALGVCMSAVCCLQILIWAIFIICRETGTLQQRFQSAIKPLNTWRLNNWLRSGGYMKPPRPLPSVIIPRFGLLPLDFYRNQEILMEYQAEQ